MNVHMITPLEIGGRSLRVASFVSTEAARFAIFEYGEVVFPRKKNFCGSEFFQYRNSVLTRDTRLAESAPRGERSSVFLRE